MPKKAKGKGFFALDIDQLFKIKKHDLGLEEAVTYLALMKSTDESNTTSRGGINSVTEYTGLTRAEAKRAVEHLTRVGLIEAIEVERKRARTVPRYCLPAHEIRPRLTDKEEEVLKLVEAGITITGGPMKNAAYRVEKKRLDRAAFNWLGNRATIPKSGIHSEHFCSHVRSSFTASAADAGWRVGADLASLRTVSQARPNERTRRASGRSACTFSHRDYRQRG